MLSLLQTGDLHLGKVFYEHSLIEDQAFMLDALFNELTRYRYDALLIGGDIYDRAVPPPEAVTLFDDFLTRLHKNFPDLCVCIIAGNHDSAKRLAFGSELFRSHNIHICTETADSIRPIFLKNREGKIEAALYGLPFLHSGMLKNADGTILRTQEDLVREAVRQIVHAHRSVQLHGNGFTNPAAASDRAEATLPAVLLCHVFTTGAQSGGSERMFAGNAELIDCGIFSFFAYTAAGHIHKTQKIAHNLYYAGAPLAYSFDEGVKIEKSTLKGSAEKSKQKNFLRVILDFQNTGQPVHTENIPVIPLRRVVRLSASFEDLFRSAVYDEYINDYIEFNYTDDLIPENAAARLRGKFPYLLSVKKAAGITQHTGGTESAYKKKLLEQDNGESLAEILYAFLTDAGVLPALEDASYTACKEEWKKAADLFAQTDKEANNYETA